MRNIAKNETTTAYLDETLKCPNCGSEYCQFYAININMREEEDAPGIQVFVSNKGAEVRHKSSNFAGRRDDASLIMMCEGCGCSWRLQLTNHKGCCLVEWAKVASRIRRMK